MDFCCDFWLIMEKVNIKIISMCNPFWYVTNRHICNIHLFDGGLHLSGPGICMLATNFICRLTYFLLADLDHPKRTFPNKNT